MPLIFRDGQVRHWEIRKIGVVGPGIVGMPMAAMLADAGICEGTDIPARVTVVQRNSPTSGWKVGAINDGRSPIGGVEPDLDAIVRRTVAAGLLRATHDYDDLRDADVILVCVQTDRKNFGPEYGPLLAAIDELGTALESKPPGNVPLIVFESTLAPSTMPTLIKDRFAQHGLVNGRDVLLGNSPNRVMPGRLVHRISHSDKLVAGLTPETSRLVQSLYSRIVTRGVIHVTNSMTAEVEKTLENAYRDVRIAYSAEIARYCDFEGIDFYRLRDEVNRRLHQTDEASSHPNAVPRGALLVPAVGVGGHCLPKDGILLWWRLLEGGEDGSRSLILEARRINDESPAYTLRLAESLCGRIEGRPVTVLGAAYRFNSEDTRNSPSLVLARLLLEAGAKVTIHDPYVRHEDHNLIRMGLQAYFTRNLSEALVRAEVIIACTAHEVYKEAGGQIAELARNASTIVDACNLWLREARPAGSMTYGGIGRGARPPEPAFVDFVVHGFKAMEHGFAGEVNRIIDFLNGKYADDPANRVDFKQLQRLAATCSTGCLLADAATPQVPAPYDGFLPRLVAHSAAATPPRLASLAQD